MSREFDAFRRFFGGDVHPVDTVEEFMAHVVDEHHLGPP
jgi:hypothetical protein